MAQPILLDSDGNSIDLGNVESESISLVQPIFTKSTPLTSASTAINAAVFGRNRTITITGRITGTDADIKTNFVDKINSWIDDDLIGVTGSYNPRLSTGTLSVICDDFSYSTDVSDPNAINYTLSLLEGKIDKLETLFKALNSLV